MDFKKSKADDLKKESLEAKFEGEFKPPPSCFLEEDSSLHPHCWMKIHEFGPCFRKRVLLNLTSREEKSCTMKRKMGGEKHNNFSL